MTFQFALHVAFREGGFRGSPTVNRERSISQDFGPSLVTIYIALSALKTNLDRRRVRPGFVKVRLEDA